MGEDDGMAHHQQFWTGAPHTVVPRGSLRLPCRAFGNGLQLTVVLLLLAVCSIANACTDSSKGAIPEAGIRRVILLVPGHTPLECHATLGEYTTRPASDVAELPEARLPCPEHAVTISMMQCDQHAASKILGACYVVRARGQTQTDVWQYHYQPQRVLGRDRQVVVSMEIGRRAPSQIVPLQAHAGNVLVAYGDSGDMDVVDPSSGRVLHSLRLAASNREEALVDFPPLSSQPLYALDRQQLASTEGLLGVLRLGPFTWNSGLIFVMSSYAFRNDGSPLAYGTWVVECDNEFHVLGRRLLSAEVVPELCEWRAPNLLMVLVDMSAIVVQPRHPEGERSLLVTALTDQMYSPWQISLASAECARATLRVYRSNLKGCALADGRLLVATQGAIVSSLSPTVLEFPIAIVDVNERVSIGRLVVETGIMAVLPTSNYYMSNGSTVLFDDFIMSLEEVTRSAQGVVFHLQAPTLGKSVQVEARAPL